MKRLFCVLAACAVLFPAISASAQEWKPPTSMKKLLNGLTVVVLEIIPRRRLESASATESGFDWSPRGERGSRIYSNT